MPAVLRSRHRSDIGSESPPKSLKSGSRRSKRGRRTDEENDNSNSAISDGEISSSGKLNSNGRPFEIISGLPCSLEIPQYNSALTHALSVKDSAVLYDSLVSSRRTWARGEMFELYFSKPARSLKEESSQSKQDGSTQATTMQIRDKMQKMCDCTMLGGPHQFPVRIFILKNEELERKWQEEQDSKKKEKGERRKRDQEEKKRRSEEKKQNQLQRKQEREKLVQLYKENKAKAKQEMEEMKLRRKEEIKKAKEEQKKYRKNISSSRAVSPSLPLKNGSPPPTNQSVNDPKMIANLNLMAQRDAKLNALMGTVANGEATLEQVEEFKKFIEIAKKMPGPPGWTVPPASAPKVNAPKHEIEKNLDDEIKEEKMDNAIKAVAKEEEKKEKKEKKEKEEVKEEKEEKHLLEKSENDDSPSGQAIEPEKQERRRRRPRGSVKSIEEDKSMQLTAFQQKYVQEVQLIVEFLEYTQSRYLLPRKAVLEYLEDTKMYKVSWVMVHNKKDIDRFRIRKIKELCKSKKTEEEKQAVEQDFDVYSDEMCPTPLYTPMTVAFTSIHKKFHPIMLHSVEPLEKVQHEMSSILNIGTRLSGYNLWYQLDGYDDKNLAESVRVDLNEHEHELRGKRQKK